MWRGLRDGHRAAHRAVTASVDLPVSVPAARRCLVLAVLLAGLGACGEAPLVSDCVPSVDPTCEPPLPEDEVVAGVNLTTLFALPSRTEVDAAFVSISATDGTSATLTPLTTGQDRQFTLALDRGGERVLTALVRVPGPAAEQTRLRTVVILTDGTDGASQADLLTDTGFAALPGRAVQVVVAYRGEALSVNGTTLPSTLDSDPYRADVADLRALLAALSQIPRVDPDRIGVLGVGRGGTVGLLTALQDERVRAVVTLGAPTDLFRTSFRAEARDRLLGVSPADPYPALDALAAPVLQLRDGEIARDQARLGLLALSPARLTAARPLPAVLALHAAGDRVVGDDQLVSLRDALSPSPGTPQITTLVDDATHETLLGVPVVQGQIAAFIDQVL